MDKWKWRHAQVCSYHVLSGRAGLIVPSQPRFATVLQSLKVACEPLAFRLNIGEQIQNSLMDWLWTPAGVGFALPSSL